jgi:allophanate hydrolase subunit 2
LQVIVGPRDDWFTNESIRRLLADQFVVDHASNRIGLRLEGAPLERARPGELLSEGLVPGAIQVPADGRPILLLADHPTTGGYPVIAVVHSRSLPLAAQLRPGQRLRFSAEGRSDPGATAA